MKGTIREITMPRYQPTPDEIRATACISACAGMQDPEREIAELKAFRRLTMDGWTVTPASLYDEEGVEGWRWDGPNNRELYCMGDWSEPPTIPDELL